MYFSEKESKRFKKKVYRGHLSTIDITFLKQFFKENQADLLILRVPLDSFYNLSSLEDLRLNYIVADVLLYYSCSLESYHSKELANKDLVYSIATTEDVEELRILIAEIFKGYTNHYYSNPHLDKTDILEGYIEWAINHVYTDSKLCYIARSNGKIVAFAACDEADGVGEGVLFGVSSSHSGKGIYTDLIRLTSNHFALKGIRKMLVSTQVQNLTVQKIWIREGFNIDKGYITIHINNLFSKT